MNIKHFSFVLSLTASFIWLGASCPLQDNLGTTNNALTVNNAETPNLEPLVVGPENLMGSWKSACLIPDENSDYAEQHYFTFFANGTALHKRETFYKKACAGSDMTLVNNYSFTVPTAGQINFTDLETGATFYDIYAQNGDVLLFGHGFRNSAESVASGASKTERINSLNRYITYSRTSAE